MEKKGNTGMPDAVGDSGVAARRLHRPNRRPRDAFSLNGAI